jgi:hypothetical protein
MLVARTADEAHLYMRMHPHSCGEHRFDPPHWQEDRDGTLVVVYEGPCARCGKLRRFEFALDPAMPPPSPSFGHGVSRILDPGEFMFASEAAAERVESFNGAAEASAQARRDLNYAIAALEEVLKFIPVGEAAVPDSAFPSSTGVLYQARHPDKFTRRYLDERLQLYRDVLASIGG